MNADALHTEPRDMHPIEVNLEQAKTALANVVRETRDQRHPVILATSRMALTYTLRAIAYYHKHSEPEADDARTL